MEPRPAGIAPDEQVAVFTASSQRVTRAVLLSQIAEAEAFDLGGCLWARQLRACVERIDAALNQQQQVPVDRRLRLVD